MTKSLRIGLLAALCAVQIAVAAVSIVRFESTLASGALYKIRSAPVDPADAFRGRYVYVQPTIAITPPIDADTERLLEGLRSGRATAYVLLARDAEGFATAGRIVADAPVGGEYLQVRHARPVWSGNPPVRNGYALWFPFDRYYMTEAAAPMAERHYVSAARREGRPNTWLTVRVKDGVGVIEGLYVDGIRIEDAIRQQPAR